MKIIPSNLKFLEVSLSGLRTSLMRMLAELDLLSKQIKTAQSSFDGIELQETDLLELIDAGCELAVIVTNLYHKKCNVKTNNMKKAIDRWNSLLNEKIIPCLKKY